MGSTERWIPIEVPLFEDEEEARVHGAAMDRLAASLGLPLEKIKPPYERIFFAMKQEARITQFLSLLVARKVKELLKGKPPI